MTQAPAATAHRLYRALFNAPTLQRVYEDKISDSYAVGLDGIDQRAFRGRLANEISIILQKVASGSYRFTSYKQRLISKGPYNFPRVISIPTIRDRLTLRVVNDILSRTFAEAQIWRPHVYIKKIRERLREANGDMAFTRIDIADFYPTIDHQILITKVRRKVRKPQIVNLIRSAISTPTERLRQDGKGVPQGLSISNILASIYLQQMDAKFERKYTYFRYVDDILVICRAEEAEAVFVDIKTEIEKLALKCHDLGKPGKSQIAPIANGIDYLGFRLTETKISVRTSSYHRMIENLLGVLTQHKHASHRRNEERLVWRLNLKITGCVFKERRFGWVFFFSQIDDVAQLSRLDSFVTQQLSKRQLGHLRPRIKRFVRAYHEVRFNFSRTRYLPKFDDFTIDNMIAVLAQEEGVSAEEYAGRHTEEEIRRNFASLVSRQTRELEQDLIEVIS